MMALVVNFSPYVVTSGPQEEGNRHPPKDTAQGLRGSSRQGLQDLAPSFVTGLGPSFVILSIP